MKRGRPKGRSGDNRSFGPLGDLIRSHRLAKGLGLFEVAKACQCSMQFISNIEHGRAPLPWEKIDILTQVLKIPLEELQVANLAARSGFKGFLNSKIQALPHKAKKTSSKVSIPSAQGLADALSTATLTSQDLPLQDLLQKYQGASQTTRKKFLKVAHEFLKES